VQFKPLTAIEALFLVREKKKEWMKNKNEKKMKKKKKERM